MLPHEQEQIAHFFEGKSAHTRALFDHFVHEYFKLGKVSLEPTKTMIAIDNGKRRVAWVSQLGKNFIHVVFPFRQPYEDNLCFQKLGEVGNGQYNHHLRVLQKEDINAEVKKFMKLALRDNV